MREDIKTFLHLSLLILLVSAFSLMTFAFTKILTAKMFSWWAIYTVIAMVINVYCVLSKVIWDRCEAMVRALLTRISGKR